MVYHSSTCPLQIHNGLFRQFLQHLMQHLPCTNVISIRLFQLNCCSVFCRRNQFKVYLALNCLDDALKYFDYFQTLKIYSIQCVYILRLLECEHEKQHLDLILVLPFISLTFCFVGSHPKPNHIEDSLKFRLAQLTYQSKLHHQALNLAIEFAILVFH